MQDIFLKLMFKLLKNCTNFIKGLPFLLERMKIRKFEKLVAILRDKTECVTHIRNLKQTLNRGLVLKTVHSSYWYKYRSKEKSKK